MSITEKIKKHACLNPISIGVEEENSIMKYSDIFMISWFGMKIIKLKIVLHQCIVYTYALGEIILNRICYQGKIINCWLI